MKQLITWLLSPYFKWRRNVLFSKAQKQLKVSVDKQIAQRKVLRMNINEFLKDYFGIDANSKYIPKDYKNAEEVKAAIIAKFEPHMKRIDVKYEDLFR